MAGIIANALDNNQTAYGADTDKVNPSLQTVDTGTQTVAGQLHSILAEDGPLSQQAKAGALDTANSRGLINSSMAAGAGQDALIKNALPIAQQDASTFGHVADVNQQADNASKAFNSGATNTANLNTAQAANTSTLQSQQTEEQVGQVIPAQTEAQSQLSAQSHTQDVALQNLRGDQATTLAQIESQYKQLMQSNASASSFYSDITTQLATVLNNPSTSSAQKTAAVGQITSLLQTGLTVIGAISNMDLTGLLTFSSTGATPA